MRIKKQRWIVKESDNIEFTQWGWHKSNLSNASPTDVILLLLHCNNNILEEKHDYRWSQFIHNNPIPSSDIKAGTIEAVGKQRN